MINYLNLVTGLSLGYSLGRAVNSDKECRQGKNYTPAGLCQFAQTQFLSAIFSVIHKQLPEGKVKIASNVAQLLTSNFGFIITPSCLLLNSNTEFPPQIRKIGIFVLDHTSSLVKVVHLTISVACTVLLNPYLGAGLLASQLYFELDNRNIIPVKISLFSERFLFVILDVVSLPSYNLIMRTLIVFSLIHSHMHIISRKINKIISKLFNWSIGLADFEAPLKDNKNMDLKQIKSILSGRFQIDLNLAHCSKDVPKKELTEDREFDKLRLYFNKINWNNEGKYNLLKGKLLDDDRFRHFLESKTGQPEILSQRLMVDWLQEQMNEAIKTLKRELGHEQAGSKSDLNEAIKYTSNLVVLLDDLYKQIDWELVEKDEMDGDTRSKLIIFEDALLKFAVEGGGYCPMAIRDVAKELNDSLQQDDPAQNLYSSDEHQILEYLLQKREEIARFWLKKIPGVTDRHFNDYFRMIPLGFLPMTEEQRKWLQLGEWELIWLIWSHLRNQMIRDYKQIVQDDKFEQIGKLKLTNYARYLIQQNNNLSENEKESLFEKFFYNNRKFNFENVKFFILISLGIYNLR